MRKVFSNKEIIEEELRLMEQSQQEIMEDFLNANQPAFYPGGYWFPDSLTESLGDNLLHIESGLRLFRDILMDPLPGVSRGGTIRSLFWEAVGVRSEIMGL